MMLWHSRHHAQKPGCGRGCSREVENRSSRCRTTLARWGTWLPGRWLQGVRSKATANCGRWNSAGFMDRFQPIRNRETILCYLVARHQRIWCFWLGEAAWKSRLWGTWDRHSTRWSDRCIPSFCIQSSGSFWGPKNRGLVSEEEYPPSQPDPEPR